MNAQLTLIELCQTLKGVVDSEGFLSLHSKHSTGQLSSIAALNKCHHLGWNFDLILIDGTRLNDVNLEHSKVLLEYETKQFSILPGNGISKWRLSSQRICNADCESKYDANKWAIPPETAERVPHYANDKYKREIKPGVFVDVYDIIKCYEVTSGPLQHALKKVLAAGQRGHKDLEQDLIDILSSTERALFQLQEEKNK